MTTVARVMEDFARISTSKEAPAETFQLQKIAEALRQRITSERYELWFDRKTRMALDGHALVIHAGNTFAAKWIRSKFSDDLHAAAVDALGRPVELVIQVDVSLAAPTAAEPASETMRSAVHVSHAKPAVQSPMVLRHTLDEFVVGASNQLAFHAAHQVAAHPGEQFNPLFLHGHCGLGKTHLLQGICHKFAKLHPTKKWLYLTGEQFTNEFLEALRTHRTEAFRRRIRGADLLVIDDVHFLANKKATQEEFLHTFNQVDSTGHQIVLASDCAPRQIQALSEQLSSRFVSGMVLRVDAPDMPTRLEILRRRVAKMQWEVTDTVLMHIAQSAVSSVRELEGMLLQVMAGIQLINSGSPAAASILTTLRERSAPRGPIAVERIVDAVAGHFSILPAAIQGSGREKAVCTARAIAMFLARRHTGKSYPEIGRAIGNKNHSTVIAACQRIESLLAAGDVLRWTSAEGPRHQAIADAIHDLEAAIRKS